MYAFLLALRVRPKVSILIHATDDNDHYAGQGVGESVGLLRRVDEGTIIHERPQYLTQRPAILALDAQMPGQALAIIMIGSLAHSGENGITG